MRVAFDSRPAADAGGIGRYAGCLLAALRDHLPEAEQANDRANELLETHRPRKVDVFHSPWIDGALLRPPVPMVVTLHDVIPLKRPSEYLRTGLRFRMRYLAVQRAARLIVPTRAVAEEAAAHLQLAEEKIAVIPEAAAPAFTPRPSDEISAVRIRYRLPERYLLWVGSLRTPDPRKRIAALAKAEKGLPLVLTGPTSRWAEELPDVTLTGQVDDDELAAIYSGAHALVFPTDDEGFGLPPVEALACGCPVVAFDVPALREVLTDRVTFAEIGDIDGLIEAAEAISRPAPAPPAWTWAQAAERTWEIYAEALRSTGRPIPAPR